MDWTGWTQIAANVATIAVILFAAFTFLVERSRVERAREEQAFETVTSHYLGFLEMAMAHPELTLAELDTDKLARARPRRWESPEDERRDAILFEYFYQVVEKVFILYRAADLYMEDGEWVEHRVQAKVTDRHWRETQMRQAKDFRARQWLGWDAWLEDYARSPIMREYWRTLDNDETYDTYFMTYMRCRLGS